MTGPNKKALVKEAAYLKAEWRAGRRAAQSDTAASPTVSECFDRYLVDRSRTLSPLTIRHYREVQKHRFTSIMSLRVADIDPDEWQGLVNTEAEKYAPKTLKNGYSAIKTVVSAVAKVQLPDVTFPGSTSKPRPFLKPKEIPFFISAVKETKYAVPLLLALSSMRISEIDALRWEEIPEDPDFIQVSGAVVLDENNSYVTKAQNKNETSARAVPLLIPELRAALERDRKESGFVMPCTQNNLRLACHRICRAAGITDVTPHGLRHSFASLCYHLKVPEKIAQEIGGWADSATMHKIYTHIAQSDIEHYQSALSDFFAARADELPVQNSAHPVENAHENAHDSEKVRD